MGHETSNIYSITYKSEHEVQELQDGIPVHGEVDQGSYEYYQFTIMQQHADLTISVTPFTYVFIAVLLID